MSAAPIYVVVCANDGVKNDDGPIILETYTKGATLERARQQAANMEASTRWKYGPCRVARLVFEDHPAFAEVAK